MIREIFVPLLGSTSDQSALDAAAAIATTQAAHITAMVILQHPMPLVTEFGYTANEIDERQLEQACSEAASSAGLARSRLERAPVSSDVHVTESMTLWGEAAAAMQALHCDISVIGKPSPGEFDGAPRFELMFRSLLLRSGRPVLVIPSGAALPLPARRIVLAWKPTPEAARALHESLPLLAHAAEIDVLVVDPKVTEGEHGQQPGAHIARHDIKVNVVEQP